MEDAFTRLSRTLDDRTKNTFAANSSVNVEIGFITANMGLKVVRFKDEIPIGDYDLSRHLTVNDISGIVQTSTAGEPQHTHNVNINRPDGLGVIQSGDRVVVVWDGTQPIVMDVIVSGHVLGGA